MIIVDFNNFWSPSGGGVRRYHLEKMDFYMHREGAVHVFVMPDSKTYTEEKSGSLIIEHVEAFRFPGDWEYRFIWKRDQVARILAKYSPEIIEVGSPYWLPHLVANMAKQFCPRAKLLAFWHADFPVTYVRRPFESVFGKAIAKHAEELAFRYARFEYKRFDGIEVSCEEIRKRLVKHGLPAYFKVPLGCNTAAFSPEKLDPEIRTELQAGDENRLVIFFPHRFCKEKGLDIVLKAYPMLCKRLKAEPAIVFAGTGPLLNEVKAAAEKYKHIHYIGFVSSEEQMARYYASSDLGLALSSWETFGISIIESMASGNPQIAAPNGAASEHVRESGAGLIMHDRSPEELVTKICDLVNQGTRTYANKARAYAEKFSWEACFEKQFSLYRELLINKKP